MQADLLHKKVGERIYTSVPRSFTIIMTNEGIPGFFKGTIASLMGVSHVMVNMPIYD